mmetsp:Transcript_13621/g.12088  ORF Transcript_13621/g.12088 Transcript_13621/m.12088 type:complete len:99 (-) Transcript_13621:7-303(-)
MNSSPQINERVEYYYIEYHRMIKELIMFLQPSFHIDIHTYECLSDYTKNPNLATADTIGIQVYSKNDNILGQAIKQGFEEEELKVFTEAYLPNLSHHQ